MAAKKPKADAPEAQEQVSVAQLVEGSKGSDKFEFQDYERGVSQPDDGALCLVKVFNEKKGKVEDGPVAIYDDKRGVFFKSPEFGGGGSIVGPRRDNYKAERIRNVTAFGVVVNDYDPAPKPDSIIDHRGGLERAETRPPQVRTPADRA